MPATAGDAGAGGRLVKLQAEALHVVGHAPVPVKLPLGE